MLYAGDELVYVAWPHQPLNSPGLSGRLGIVYCVNRACALHSTRVPNTSLPRLEESEVDSPSLPFASFDVATIKRALCKSQDCARSVLPNRGSREIDASLYVNGMQEPALRCLTPALKSALSPRFTPDNKRILFLSHSAAASSGVHNATAALCSLPWPCQPLQPSVSCYPLLQSLSRPLDSSLLLNTFVQHAHPQTLSGWTLLIPSNLLRY